MKDGKIYCALGSRLMLNNFDLLDEGCNFFGLNVLLIGSLLHQGRRTYVTHAYNAGGKVF